MSFRGVDLGPDAGAARVSLHSPRHAEHGDHTQATSVAVGGLDDAGIRAVAALVVDDAAVEVLLATERHPDPRRRMDGGVRHQFVDDERHGVAHVLRRPEVVEEMTHTITGLPRRVGAGQQREVLDVVTYRAFVANRHRVALLLPPKIRLLSEAGIP